MLTANYYSAFAVFVIFNLGCLPATACHVNGPAARFRHARATVGTSPVASAPRVE
jgi:hypothetical protein